MHGIMEIYVYEIRVLKIVHFFFLKYNNVMQAYKVVTCFGSQLCKLCILEFACVLVKWRQMSVAGFFV